MVIVNTSDGGAARSYGGLNETETPGGSPRMVALGLSLAMEFPAIVGVSVEVRVPPMPAVRVAETEEAESRATPVSTSKLCGGAVVALVEVVVMVVAVVVVDDEEEVVLVVVEVVVEVELEGGSISPISIQGMADEDNVKGKYVGEVTPLVAYSALPPSVPPLDPGDMANPAPAVVETRPGSPTILTRKAPL
jgi:hypothetical protein